MIKFRQTQNQFDVLWSGMTLSGKCTVPVTRNIPQNVFSLNFISLILDDTTFAMQQSGGHPSPTCPEKINSDCCGKHFIFLTCHSPRHPWSTKPHL